MTRSKFLAHLSLVLLAPVGELLAEDREEKPRFKGVEMYSWKDAKQGWVYALLSGTNRLKTEAEVKSSPRLVGTGTLGPALEKLAEGEQVFWSSHGLDGFELPPVAKIREIKALAKKARVKLSGA